MTRGLSRLAVCAVLAACGGDGLQQVDPTLVWNPTSLDFGDRPVLDELEKPVSLLNAGTPPLEISSMRIEGDDAFTLVEPLSELEGGAETDLLVRFVATEMRSYAATLVIESNDAENPKVEIPLTGAGTTAAAAVIEPEALDFGRVGEGRSAVRRVKITSTGTADLKIRTIAFKPGSSAAYGFVGSTRTPQELAKRVAGQEDAFAEITVKFAPTSAVTDTEGVLLLETTDPDNATVEIPLTAQINRQPVAVTGPDRQVAPGTLVELDGSESHDPDGDDPISFLWTLVQVPQGSATTLADAETATPSLTPDRPGSYVVDLVVTDAAGLSSAPKRVTVSGVTSDKLTVHLLWDHPTADLDLHMRPEGAAFEDDKDCFWPNPNPDWGVQGNPDDDPAHLGDRLSGFGPEVVVYEEPADGRYIVAVKYVSPQGSEEKTLRATIRVYLYGVIQRELSRTLSTPGEVWNAALVEWPSGTVSTAFSGTTP